MFIPFLPKILDIYKPPPRNFFFYVELFKRQVFLVRKVCSNLLALDKTLKDIYVNPNILSINEFISGLPTLINKFVHDHVNQWRIMFNQLNLDNFDLDVDLMNCVQCEVR
jgi:hypothetical protein